MKYRRILCAFAVMFLALTLVSCSSRKNTKIVDIWIDFSPYVDSPAASIREILAPPSAWQNEKLTVSAPRVRYEVENGKYTYAKEWEDGKFYYEFECDADLKELYIQAPLVNVCRPMDEYTVSTAEGETLMRNGKPWFTVNEVRVTAGELVIVCSVEEGPLEMHAILDGKIAEGVTTGHQRESGKKAFDYTIRVTYPDGNPIDPEDVTLSIMTIDEVYAVDAIYTTGSDVTLIPVGR